eukprot:4018155-Karenia_brevis.AAC.1
MFQEGAPGPGPTGENKIHHSQHHYVQGLPHGKGATTAEPKASAESKIAPANKSGLGWIAFGTARNGWIAFGAAILICIAALGWAVK